MFNNARWIVNVKRNIGSAHKIIVDELPLVLRDLKFEWSIDKLIYHSTPPRAAASSNSAAAISVNVSLNNILATAGLKVNVSNPSTARSANVSTSRMLATKMRVSLPNPSTIFCRSLMMTTAKMCPHNQRQWCHFQLLMKMIFLLGYYSLNSRTKII
jgi:hypothetical protein